MKKTWRFFWINCLGSAGLNILIHEVGHAAAITALFRNGRPKIAITPFEGGKTRWFYSRKLTQLGTYLGESRSLLAVTAAGFGASTLWAMGEFAIAHFMQGCHPEMSEGLELHALTLLMQEILYGFSTFSIDLGEALFAGHDFAKLWFIWGIHPLIPVAFILLLPCIEKLLLIAWTALIQPSRNCSPSPNPRSAMI